MPKRFGSELGEPTSENTRQDDDILSFRGPNSGTPPRKRLTSPTGLHTWLAECGYSLADLPGDVQALGELPRLLNKVRLTKETDGQRCEEGGREKR